MTPDITMNEFLDLLNAEIAGKLVDDLDGWLDSLGILTEWDPALNHVLAVVLGRWQTDPALDSTERAHRDALNLTCNEDSLRTKAERKVQTERHVFTAPLLRYLLHDPEELVHTLLCFGRHSRGDWGEVDAEDQATNDAALRDGDRLLSAYMLPSGRRIWIITEWDRSVTTLLFPEDY